MSWDIYGNPLARGHCEVHPHVHEEYPCSVCMAEKRQREQASQQSEAEYYMQMEIEDLKAANSALGKSLEQFKWISVNDEMPKPEQSGKVIGINGDLVFDLTYEDEIWCNVYGEKFTHWMPLPKPPEAD